MQNSLAEGCGSTRSASCYCCNKPQVGRGRQSSERGRWPGGTQGRMGGLVALWGPTSRGKSAWLAEKHSKLKRFGAVHPGRATASEA